MKRTTLALALATAFDAAAVSLNPDGLGQALIFPYYTVRSSEGGNAFNTYLSVVNHTADAKAVRVRVREGRNAREVAAFNLYLSPNDVWTGAIAPTGAGSVLYTVDTSCTDPAFTASDGLSHLDFRNTLYTGAFADTFGDTLDRTREGYVEMIEMATLSGASRAQVSHNSAGVPANCAAIRATNSPDVASPTGGLSGTLTLINVNSGMDFTVNAEALADLATRPYFRAATDPYPDLAAAEIDPVSVVIANGQVYRSVWTRPVDAVSAVLMRQRWIAEYVLDSGTASRTDLVVTLPTRHFHATVTQGVAPFSQPAVWAANCRSSTGAQLGESLQGHFFDREARGAISAGANFPEPPPNTPTDRLCAASAVASVSWPSRATSASTQVLGSVTQGAYGTVTAGYLVVAEGFQNGWTMGVPVPAGTLTSLPSSTRVDLASGALATGAHAYSGLPVVGFSVRTFRNGTLQCGRASCQGNYGGSFPFKYTRRITPP